MVLDQFVMLGKTVPESNSDGRQFVCTAGYDLELRKPVRIYPMARRDCPKRWSVSRIPVERNPKDSRAESWKIRGDRSCGQHEQINAVINTVRNKIEPEIQREILKSLEVKSLKQANAERLSLAVVFPDDVPQLKFEPGEQAEMAPTRDMFGHITELPVAQRFKWHPRLEFSDCDGKHDLMLREWGCYELMRKQGDDYTLYNLGEALNLSTAPPLLCGNLNQHRNSWLVISAFTGAVHARSTVIERQAAMFDFIPDELHGRVVR
jgi:hypothetical protein